MDGPGPSSCDNGNAPLSKAEATTEAFSPSLTLPSPPVRSRVQVSISKQKAATQPPGRPQLIKTLSQRHWQRAQHQDSDPGRQWAAGANPRPVGAAALATALPTHTPGRQLDGRPGSSSASESANGRSGRTDTSFLNTWFSRLDQAEQTAHQHQTEASRARLTASDWEQKYEELQRKCRARDTEVHERILSLQSEILLLKNEKQSLCTDMDECHAARRGTLSCTHAHRTSGSAEKPRSSRLATKQWWRPRLQVAARRAEGAH